MNSICQMQLKTYFLLQCFYHLSIDCKELYESGIEQSGAFFIQPSENAKFKAYCDMETDGGGWTVIQRRVDGTTDFHRNWHDYKHGFGDAMKNFWIGLENMHALAAPGKGETLRIELKHWLHANTKYYAKYGSFQIADESNGYRLDVANYTGNAGDAFDSEMSPVGTACSGMKFSTFDNDNDKKTSNCAVEFTGGWWFNRCHNCHLNGLYPNAPTSSPKYMSWKSIGNNFGYIYFSEMKVRRL